MPPQQWNFEPIANDHLAAVLQVNQLYQHLLSPLTMEELLALLGSSSHHRSVGSGTAFLIALDDQSDHSGENFRWFKARYDSFVYIDRIAIGEPLQRRGLAVALYKDLEAEARESGREYLCAEVGLIPPNEASLKFHDGFGFERVGTGKAGGKIVQYFAKSLLYRFRFGMR